MIDAKKLLDGMIASSAAPEGAPGGGADAGGLLGGLLGKLQQGAQSAGLQTGGGMLEMAKQVLGQATSGVKDAAGKAEAATGAGAKADELLRQLTGGQGGADLLATARDLISKNPAASGALAGILGGLLLGSQTGRSLGWNAAKLGGLVLIGGLAYKAYQNYQQGKPVLAGGDPQPAPADTGFGAAKQSNEDALLYLRAMIAAAAADGTVDAMERGRIVSSLSQVGMDAEATSFLDAEFAKPASIEALAAGARTPEVRAQVYTAARLAIDPDTDGEKAWLAGLATALALDPGLVQHLDAAANSAKV